MTGECVPGLIAVGLVTIGVASWSFMATMILKGKLAENVQLRKQRDELMQSWQLILNHGREEEEEP